MNALLLDERDLRFTEEYVLSDGDTMLAVMRSNLREPGLTMYDMAVKTMKRPEIQEAIREARKRKKWAQPIEFTQRSIAEDLERVYEAAVDKQDFRAAIMAKDAQLRALNLTTVKVEVSKARSPDDMTTAEIEAYLRSVKVIEGHSERVDNPGDDGSKPAGEAKG